jgi:arylsulfatase A-like enzyme
MTAVLDLSSHADTPGRLLFRAEAPRSAPFRIFVGLSPPFGLRRPGERNLVLICIDTLRADHLSCQGYWRETSPFLDAASERGTRFARCNSQAPWTVPSLYSLFTGQYPSCHYRREPGGTGSFNAEAPTLAHILAQDGFYTAAIVGGGTINPSSGMARGFNSYCVSGQGGKFPAVFELARAWLAEHKDDRFFLLLHTFEVHAPYTRRIFAAGSSSARSTALGNYDSGIRFADNYLERLFGVLDKLGLQDNTVVVLFGDHGEDFTLIKDRPKGPEGEHGQCLLQSCLHVPLVFWGPGVPAGRVIGRQVQLMDAMPTVLQLLGLGVPDHVQAISLLPLMQGHNQDPQQRPAFSEGLAMGPERKALVLDGWKYIETMPMQNEGVSEGSHYWWESQWYAGLAPARLFRLGIPRAEQSNLVETEKSLARQLAGQLHQLMQENARIYQANRERFFSVDEQTREHALEGLRALGYL